MIAVVVCTDKVGIGMFVPSPWCGRGMFLFPNLPHESNKTCKLTDELTSLSLLQLAPPSSSESIIFANKNNQQTTVEMAAGMRKFPLGSIQLLQHCDDFSNVPQVAASAWPLGSSSAELL